MRNLIPTFLLLATLAFGQGAALSAEPVAFLPVGMILGIELNGPALTPFVLFLAAPNPFALPPQPFALVPLLSGQTDPAGHFSIQLPLQGVAYDIDDLVLGGILAPPPPSPPIVTELVSLSLTGTGPPLPPPCGAAGPPTSQDGAMSYRGGPPCRIILKVRVCPGDAVSLNVNGVPIFAAVAPASGVVQTTIEGTCLSGADALTCEVGGAVFLGPIHGVPTL
jgi:hypothetical protein